MHSLTHLFIHLIAYYVSNILLAAEVIKIKYKVPVLGENSKKAGNCSPEFRQS